MTTLEAVIGLEIHVQLQTRTKMFCRCPNRYGDPPNTNVCPVCLAHPGMLPVANRAAVEQALRVGLALGCRVPAACTFDRKNYFYPDSPKGYQISQFQAPLCAEGTLVIPGRDESLTVGIVRCHLEEDAAKTIHIGGASGRIAGSDASVVDFNRAGTPLLEIVTEPDLRSGEQARRFLTMLRATIISIGASECDMEKGSLRCDANVSVRRRGDQQLGTKCELKNMNSFRFLERGINAEIARQRELIESGGAVRQATLHYDPARDALSVLRLKEEADDYRYFPEPDLVALAPSAEMTSTLNASLPELPVARIDRLRGIYGLSTDQAETLVLAPMLGDFFEQVVAEGAEPRQAANWTLGEYAAHLRFATSGGDATLITPRAVAELAALVGDGSISITAAKQVFARMAADPTRSAAEWVAELGLAAIVDADALAALVDGVLAEHPDQVVSYRAGKTALAGFFVGQVMRASGGSADPRRVQTLVRERLDACA